MIWNKTVSLPLAWLVLTSAFMCFSAELLAQEPVVLRQEAEIAVLNGAMVVGLDEAASNGAYVWTRPGDDRRIEFFDFMEFSFDVTIEGVYQISGGVYSISEASDSFYVQVDNSRTYRWFISRNALYESDYINDKGARDLFFRMSAGTHVVRIFRRETGTRLDWLAMELVSE